MTPEERAKHLRHEMLHHGLTNCPSVDAENKLDALIAQAIGQAVAEEREACAKIAEEHSDAFRDYTGAYTANAIMNVIHARARKP